MLEGLEQQEQDAAARELSFLDRLALLVDRQWTWRQNQILTRRLQASRLKGAACIENIDYRAERGLNRTVIRGLAQDSTWVKNHAHIFVLGPTGVGKSYVASALAQKACRDGYAVYYTRAVALFRDMNLARADGSLRQLLRRLNRIDVLVIDDWAMAPMAESERRDFWEIAEDRYQARSMILTSQLPVSRWHEQIGDPRWPMPSSIVWCTMPTASTCVGNRCASSAKTKRHKSRRGEKTAMLSVNRVRDRRS
jgi:DNA replication protein DnaC